MHHLPPVQPTPPARKPLAEMTPFELCVWFDMQIVELDTFCHFVQGDLLRRMQRGQRTATDDRYEQFLAQAADLQAGLEELRQATEQAALEEPNA